MKIGIIPGDGVGPEVTAQAVKVLTATGVAAELTEYDLGGQRYLRTGELLPESVLAELAEQDAILLGAVGHPDVKPGIVEREILLRMRFEFDLAVNLRPINILPGVASPLAGVGPGDIDIVCIRENTEGLYAGGGGSLRTSTPNEIATQESVNTRLAIERCVRYAFELATKTHRRHLTLVHKTNVLTHAGGLWQRTFDEVGTEFPTVATSYGHVDAVCLWLVEDPGRFDVIVTDNMFGDIVTDLGAAITGGLGYACSANINIAGDRPSVFEPVHGSAPDIAGKGIANPVAAVLSLQLALSQNGEHEAAAAVRAATESEVASVGPDIGITVFTDEVGDAIAAGVGAYRKARTRGEG